jgi:hypothetical protein
MRAGGWPKRLEAGHAAQLALQARDACFLEYEADESE